MRFFAAVLALFTALTAVMTWPQALHMRDAVHDDGDPLLNTWALAWVAHQLPIAPAHLFDANIFYPERRTLAFSETLIAPAIAAAPLQWIGIGPLLVSNIVLLSGFIVSGAGMALLVRSLTGRAGPAILAGIVFAFLPYRFEHYAHLQLQQTQWMPFMFWAFHRLLDTGRLKDGVLLGMFSAAQGLSCTYYALFLIPYAAVVWGSLLIMRGPRYERAIALLVAGVIAVAAVIPVGIAHMRARTVVGERNRDEVVQGSATWRNYLAPPPANVVYGGVLGKFGQDERRLFPGFLALALAIVALAPATKTRKHENAKEKTYLFRDFAISWFRADPRWAYALGLLIAFDISLGMNGVTFPILYDYAVPFRAIRSPARMGVLAGFSLAVLAGFGAARIGERIRTARARRTVFVAIAVGLLIEYASAPIPLQPIPTKAPAAYADLLRDVGDGPAAAIVEYPMSNLHDDPTYMFYSTAHWQNLVNGYSGFFPVSYLEFSDHLADLPDEQWISAFRQRRVRYLLVHGERMNVERYKRTTGRLDRFAYFTLMSRTPSERYGQHGEISLYRFVHSAPP